LGVQGQAGSVQGVQGALGIQGAQGTQGTQGVQGVIGNQGIQGGGGLQGVQGAQGTQAAQGAFGNQGAIGYGNQGTTGFGLQGNIGSQGLNGNQGPQNFQGTQGAQGTQAAQGAQGAQGVQGQTGQGNQGPVGPGGLGSGVANHLAYYTGASVVTADSTAVTDGAGNITVASLYSNNNVTAYSDARLKTNVVTIENALDKAMALRGVTFNRINEGTVVGVADHKTFMGVIAQEVQKVIPEVVFQAKNGTDLLSVDYGNIVGLLIEAIKELKSEVDQLKK
jgi:hypothetical protein